MMKFFCLLFISLLQMIGNAKGLKCYKCDSAVDINCVNDLTKFSPMECAANEISCGTRLDSKGTILRECINPDIECMDPLCRECHEDGCNSNLICYNCDSSKKPNCAQLTSTKISVEVCPSKTDKCLTIVKDKNIERKCTSTKCDESKAKTCQTCEKSYCNIEVFPKERQLCYQCTKDNADCNELKAIKPIPCLLYDENDKCYTNGTSATDMNRGCMSDIDNKCSGNTCATCDDQNCNKLPFIREPLRKCFQCELNETNCPKDAKICKKPLEYWKEKEECFTKTTNDKTIKGCVNDYDENFKMCIDEDTCTFCEEDGCNSGVVGLHSTFILVNFLALTFFMLV